MLAIHDPPDIEPLLRKCEEEGNPIQVGDLIYFAYSDGSRHAAIVSDIDSNMIYYAAHSHDYKHKELSKGMGQANVVNIIRINNSNN